MQLVSRLGLAVIATLCGAWSDGAAQEAPPPRPHLAFGLSAVTRVPGYGDEGLGPLASLTHHLPVGASGGLLVGAGYGIVFTNGWTSIDGVRYDYAPEAVILSLGAEFVIDERRTFAVDAQWNPAVARVRRLGRVPEWATGSAEWRRVLAVGSLGARWTLPTTRGPVIAVALRTYVHLHPYVLMGGGGLWPALGVVLRAR